MIIQNKNADGYWIVTKDPSDEYNTLQQLARDEGSWESIFPQGKDYYIVYVENDTLCVSYTAKKFNNNSFSFSTIYSNPTARSNFSMRDKNRMFIDSINLFFENDIENIKLGIIARLASKPRLWSSSRYEWTSIPHTYYLMSLPKHLQRSWKRIAYYGDQSLLNMQSMSTEKYKVTFGDLFYRNSLPQQVSEIDSPGKTLIINDVDGQITNFLVAKFKQHNSFSVDSITDRYYNISKGLELNLNNTFTKNINKVDLVGRVSYTANSDVYDTVIVWTGCQDNHFQYITADNKDYRSYCSPKGNYIDVR